ncbi:putative peptidoglycan binding protein [Orenia metallireducens]|uniref:Predicted Peptidoglycan domain-containing protein n=1 Tax=Orenia metallireducens TaxID=1413210 RepID=A0A285HC63_9FIRM|nr:glycosyl hydrolase 108 family protein [Orenia metallireducens]PRX27675.1 putative peptidoglycan binding protein [Orenia metallireducens]SNY33328.1 Predicted Peptidoglycan domain-containing protein [Orenia metallireducens]
MDKNFEKAFQKILQFEGKYSDDKDDRGGKTKYGISETIARESGYQGEMKDLTLDQAKGIYYQNYWVNLNYHKIKAIDIAIECFEQAVHIGPKRATSNLQLAYNLLTEQEIEVDGIVGSNTLKGVNNSAYGFELLQLLNILQGERYISICKADKSQKKFIRGWLKRTLL